MAMVTFKKVTLKNFLSYGNNVTEISLDQTGTTLIVGEDLDNTSNGQGANGVGKSSIINAISYALYDKPISNISKDNLVNNINKKNMEVTVDFIATSGVPYHIKRTRKTKAGAAGNAVYIFEDGKDVTPDSVSNANDFIVKLLGIPYELFVRIVVFSASHIPFLDLPTTSHYAANQRDIIEELFGVTMLTQKADMLKDVIKDTEVRLNVNESKIRVIEDARDRHNIQIESAKKRVVNWDKQNNESINELESKLAVVGDVDVDEQQRLHTELKTLKSTIKDKNDELSKIEHEQKNCKKIIRELKSNLIHLKDDKCPYCLQGFHDDVKLIETEGKLNEIQETLSELEKTHLELTTEIDSLNTSLDLIKRNIKFNNLEELLNTRNHSDQIVTKINELKAAVNPYIDPLDELIAMSVEEIDYTEINKVTKDLEHQKFLLKLLTKKDSFVRKALLNKNIPYLNQRLSHYLTLMGLPHKVEFTHEMTASISQFGHELDFGNLSAGQRARVNLALSLAFRDVLQNMHTKINILMLDEVLDHGLDSIGVQSAVKMLKRMAREEKMSLYVITHREVDSSFDHTLTIQLSKGFSSVIQSV